VSVQVEVAWGRPSGPYQGIAQDLTDFPFMDALGLSSYPYLGGFAVPEDLPPDYYSKVAEGTTLPVLVVEGGWPSIAVGSFVSSPALQARYLTRQLLLLDHAAARGVFQLTFYDSRSLRIQPTTATQHRALHPSWPRRQRHERQAGAHRLGQRVPAPVQPLK